MLLFKIMRGTSANISLDITPFHDGWAYFCTDDGGFYIDSEVDGVQKRTRTNALRYNEGKIESYENGTWVEVPLDIEELESHVANTDIHVTADDKAAWNAKAEISEIKSATLSADNWIGETSPYTQTLTVEGVTASCNGLISLGQDVSFEIREATRDAMLSILNQGENSITIVADGDKPSIDIPITVVIVH